MRIVWLVLAALIPVRALHIHGNKVHLSAALPKEREGRLWVLQTHIVPARVHRYLGHHTFVVSSLGGVESGNVSELQPEHKYHPGIDAFDGIVAHVIDSSAKMPIAGRPMGKTKVFYKGRMSLSRVRRIAESANVLNLAPVAFGVQLHTPPSPRQQLLGYSPLLPPFGAGVNIMVSDSGFDPTHCFFYALNTSAVPVQYAPGMYTNPAVYNNSHGTKVAGVAVGRTCAGQMGVANESGLLFVDLTLTPGVLVLPQDWGVVYALALAKNVTLHTIGWGLNTTEFGVYDNLAADLDGLAYTTGILPCVAAGNSGPAGYVTSPATCKNCLSVGGCLSNPSWIASFSSQGVRDGRVHVPLVSALAFDVTVAESQTPAAPDHATFTTDLGTSLAAPAICGMAAWINQYFVQTTGSTASAAMLMATVVNWAVPATAVVDPYTMQPVPGYVDLSFGVPVLNLLNTTYLDNLATTGGSYTVCFKATSTAVAATLAWIDPPAAPYSSSVLVNDLDMVIIVNGVATAAPTVQNVEKIRLTVAVGATLELTVFVQGLLSTPSQGFALALTGVAQADCGVIPCKVPHGSGLLADTECVVNQCDEWYYVTHFQCMCQPTKDCGDGVLVQCIKNEFPACPGPFVGPADMWSPAFIVVFAVVWVCLIVFAALICTWCKDTPIPTLPPLPKLPPMPTMKTLSDLAGQYPANARIRPRKPKRGNRPYAALEQPLIDEISPVAGIQGAQEHKSNVE